MRASNRGLASFIVRAAPIPVKQALASKSHNRSVSLRKAIKYTDEVDPTWSIASVEMFQVTPRPDSEEPVVLELDGHCPRCRDHMQHTEFLIAFKGVSLTSWPVSRDTVKSLRAAGVVNEPLLPTEFSVRCSCQVNHPDPLGRSGLTGCGAIWKMRIESVDEGAK